MKEIFTAYYDRENDEIHGCKEGGLIYRHEEGHRHLSPFLKGFYGVLNPILTIAMCVFMMESQNIVIRFIGAFAFSAVMAEEIYAWAYAFKKRR
jgi:hypothetical protein